MATNKSQVGQLNQGLAHRVLPHSKILGDLLLDHPVARTQLFAQDSFFEQIGHTVSQTIVLGERSPVAGLYQRRRL
jgi:hypothetical protein